MKDENKLNLKYLPQYGFDDDILNDMIKYEIMFPIDKRTRNGKTDYYVKRSDILFFINTMLKNQMKVYEMVEKVNEQSESASTLIDQIITEKGE